jgi:hypothetical protein
MPQLPDIFIPHLQNPPDTLQFAKDRKYEESWIIYRNESRPTNEEIGSYIHRDDYDLIIVEYIWNLKDDDNRFVLTVFYDEKCRLKDSAQFVSYNLDIFYQYTDFRNFINEFNDKIIGHDFLFQHSIEGVTIGIFNHWFSFGPLDLWGKGQPYEQNTIENLINSRTEIKESSLNYQGLFFRFNFDGNQPGPYYGIKTPCCTKIDNKWVVDFDKVHYWMSNLIV